MFQDKVKEVFKMLENAFIFAKWSNTKLRDLAIRTSKYVGFNFNRTKRGKILSRTKVGELEKTINLFLVFHEGRQYVNIFTPNTDEEDEYDPCTCDNYYDKVEECVPLTIGYRQKGSPYRPKNLRGEWFHFTGELEDGDIYLPKILTLRPRFRPGHDIKISDILKKAHKIPKTKLRSLHYTYDVSLRLDFDQVQTKSLFEEPYGCRTKCLYRVQLGLDEWEGN
jgi:hypothetical protein